MKSMTRREFVKIGACGIAACALVSGFPGCESSQKKGDGTKRYKLCNEFLDCGMNDCPSFNNKDNDKCWTVEGTMSVDPVTKKRKPQKVAEKTDPCCGPCKYNAYRKELGE